jgi:prepilin-type processing-associated H-X9-DG protein
MSSKYPYDTAWMNVAYEYGGGRDSAIGLFIDGHVELIPKEKGIAMHAMLSDMDVLD